MVSIGPLLLVRNVTGMVPDKSMGRGGGLMSATLRTNIKPHPSSQPDDPPQCQSGNAVSHATRSWHGVWRWRH